ncbi:MAG TPA: pyrroline-5-carboxylate reductase [Gammaproteobacteria bacterium]|nr:pyrroline-5-carboxylate reductase [Gammaproteobacteria bacterium]
MSSDAALPTYAFIGGGNLARALIGGLLRSGTPATAIRVANPGEAKRVALARDFGVFVTPDNAEAASVADVWVLAVKPQAMAAALAPLTELARLKRPLVISVAAGITTGFIRHRLGAETAVVRAMPNTPALVGAGITGLFADPDLTPAQRARAAALLGAVGEVVWLDDESLMDAVTAVSGSGPAYFFLLVEAMREAGEALGLPAEAARRLSEATAYGAARLLHDSGETPEALRTRVTSPGGTTAAALAVFERDGFRAMVRAALTAARDRGRELARQYGGD